MIGILAGMGPDSTAPFIDRVVHECRIQYGATHDIDFPKMMIYSLPTPFFADRPLDHEAMETVLCGGVKALERAGARVVAMACNTAHIYYPKLAASIQSRLLNIARVTVAAIPPGLRKVAVLASRPTIASGLYEASLREHGLAVVVPTWQSEVDALIGSLRFVRDPAMLKRRWAALADMAEEALAESIVVACMDLSAIAVHLETDIPVVDSGDCLARALVSEWLVARAS